MERVFNKAEYCWFIQNTSVFSSKLFWNTKPIECGFWTENGYLEVLIRISWFYTILTVLARKHTWWSTNLVKQLCLSCFTNNVLHHGWFSNNLELEEQLYWRMWCSIALFKTFDVKVQVHFVPEHWRQTFWKVLLFL